MTALQLNAINIELWQSIAAIADKESLMKRLARYAKKLVSEKQADQTLFTEKEFFARVDEAREQIKRGEGIEMMPEESLDDFLKRVG